MQIIFFLLLTLNYAIDNRKLQYKNINPLTRLQVADQVPVTVQSIPFVQLNPGSATLAKPVLVLL